MKTTSKRAQIFLAVLLAAALAPQAHAAEPSEAWRAWLSGVPLKDAKAQLQREWDKGPPTGETAFGLAQALALGGERERSIVAALEGLKADPASPFAFALLDMISEDADFNTATSRLALSGLEEVSSKAELDPYLRFRLRWVLLRMAPRTGDPRVVRQRRKDCGFVPGAFFSKVEERLSRLNFLERQAGEEGPPKSGDAYFEVEGPQVRPPAYRMGQGGEGVFRAVSPFRVETDSDALLYFNTSRSFRAYLDGALLFERNVLEDQANPSSLWKVRLSPGLHRLVLKVQVGSSGDGVNLALLTGRGEPLPITGVNDLAAASGPTAPSKSLGPAESPYPGAIPVSDPRRPALDALFLRFQGDVAAGRLAMEDFALANPKVFLWNLWAARFYLFEAEDLPAKIAESRADRVLQAALEAEPTCPMARFFKALLVESHTESGEDMTALRDLVQEYPLDPRWGLKLAGRMGEKGWRHEALAVLSDLSIQHPDCPQVIWAMIAHFTQVPDRDRQKLAIEKLAKTGAALEAWESYFAEVGDWDALVSNLKAQVDLYGDRDLRIAKKLADADYRAGRYEEARKGYLALAKADPNDPAPPLTAARCAFLLRDREGGMRLMDDVKARNPETFQVDLARWVMGDTLPFQEHRLTLEQVLKEDRSSGPEEAPSSLVLDQQFTRVQSDGSSVERYHGVIRVNNKDGVDREGEQSLEGQVVLMARTVKPDGAILEPEQIPEKRTLSMSGLQPGDLVEIEYITLRPPNRIRKGTYLTSSVFLFQDIDRPFHRTQWYVEYPKSIPMEFSEQNLPGAGVRSERDGTLVANWDYRAMPRIAPEPDTPHRFLYVPLVEAVGGISWKDIGAFLKDSMLGSFQKTPELRAAYRQAVKGAAQDQESLLKAIIDYVMKEIEGEDDGSWQDPTQTLLNRQGGRVPVVGAFLDLAGISWEVLLAEPVPNRTFRDDLPRMGNYSLPVLRVHLKGAPVRDLVLVSRHRAVNPLPWYLQGARTLSPLASDPAKVVVLGSDFSAWKSSEEVEIRTLLPAGDLRLEHRQTFDPDGGEMLRGSFSQIPKDQWEQVLQMALSKQLGSLDMESFELHDLDDTSKPFRWEYTALVNGFAVHDGERLLIAEPIPALHLSRAMASLRERKLPLAPPGVTFLNQKYTVVIPEGYDTDCKPRSVNLSTPYGTYRLTVKREGRTFTFQRALEIPYQVIPPAKYDGFAAFLDQADTAESGQMVLTPVKP
jgi:cellulose synthase operon protein C